MRKSIRPQEAKFDIDLETFSVKTPGAIQPHGFLVAVNPKSFVIECISQNAPQYLRGMADGLLGKSLNMILSEQQVADLKVSLNKQLNIPQLHHFTLLLKEEKKYFYGLVYQTQKVIILELEPTDSTAKPNTISFQGLIEDTLVRMQQVTYLSELL